MTNITHADVVQLAKLSSLQLSDDEQESLEKDLSNILSYVEQLETLNTDNVVPTYQLGGQSNIWRDDTVDQPLDRSNLLALSPDIEAKQIKVPKVL